MTQEIWFRNDIGNVLLGISQASQAAGGSDEFRSGFRAAMLSAAISFGLADGAQYGPAEPRVDDQPPRLRRMIGADGNAVLVQR